MKATIQQALSEAGIGVGAEILDALLQTEVIAKLSDVIKAKYGESGHENFKAGLIMGFRMGMESERRTQ